MDKHQIISIILSSIPLGMIINQVIERFKEKDD